MRDAKGGRDLARESTNAGLPWCIQTIDLSPPFPFLPSSSFNQFPPIDYPPPSYVDTPPRSHVSTRFFQRDRQIEFRPLITFDASVFDAHEFLTIQRFRDPFFYRAREKERDT